MGQYGSVADKNEISRGLKPGINDITSTYPEVATQAYGWDPSNFTYGSNVLKEWRCELGHHYQSKIANRTLLGRGCPYCAHKKILTGFNDMATTHPTLARQVVGVDPTTVFASTAKSYTWRCDNKHEWIATAVNRAHGKGCPYCRGLVPVKGVNDLATTHPRLAAECLDLDPTSVVPGSEKRSRWQCQKGHIWEATVFRRALQGGGCPYCAGKKVRPGFNDLAFKRPDIAVQANGWDPTTVTPFSDKMREWICELGHTWTSSVKNRSLGNGCPTCSGKQVKVGFNDLATVSPEIAAQALGWDPTEFTAGSGVVKLWRCEKGHEWETTIAARSTSGCPTCAPYGYDPGSAGFLYLLSWPEEGLLKIGITNYLDQRLSQHEKTGFVMRDTLGPMAGTQARAYERQVLSYLDGLGVRRAPKRLGKFNGYTETWLEADFSVEGLAELVEITS